MQERYWKFMVQIKSSLFYLNVYAENSYKAERRLNIILALTSSTSIAGWAIWSKYAFVWACIIALAQVLTAIKIYLPFAKRLEIIKTVIDEINPFYYEVESYWHKVASGEMSEDEINTTLTKLKTKYSDIEEKKLNESVLIDKAAYLTIAEHKTTNYFENNF